MSTVEHDWQDEQQRVDLVISEIGKRKLSLQEQVSDLTADIIEIRRNFWDDVTVNIDDAGEMVETIASMRQQAEVLSERERSHRHARKQLKTLIRLEQSPYFGRIDFLEDGEKKAERIYVGIGSLLAENEMDFLVYDWRAPVSSLYYDYAPGPSQYQTPGGTIRGEMELKRQFIIRGGEIRSMFDTGFTIGDELLQEVLGKQTDAQMKSIVATIQKEQNLIIRDERSRLLIVQGAAGSGKTSAALQRVAYLLYRYRETLRAEQIVLFSPNPMFNSYVSTVLPELGEENMQQTTFMEYVEHRVEEGLQPEDPFAQMEYTLSAMEQPEYEARMAGIRYKASLAFMQMIDHYASALGKQGLIFRDLRFRERTLISADRISEQFYSLDSALPIPNRMRLLAEWLLGKLKERARVEQNKPWVEDEVELLDNDEYARVYQELRRQKRFTGESFDDYEREQELLAAKVVQEHFKPLRTWVKQLSFIDMPGIYRQLFAEPQVAVGLKEDGGLLQNWPAICRWTVEQLDRGQLPYEDATPYLYLKERIEGFQTNTSIRHVFIDEGQDYSPFQFAFIKRLFPYSKMTVLGDFNQAIYAHAAQSSEFGQMPALFGEEQTQTIILTRSYRSTRPIVEFTRGLIHGGEAIEPFNRAGGRPTLTLVADSSELADKVAKRIHHLQADGHRTIAVITKTAAESREAYEALKGLVSITLMEKETASFRTGTLVIPAYLAKGVEFDAVIIYNGSRSQYGRENERKLFYTACTRAMHELHLYSVGEISPFLDRVSPETYVVEA